MKLPPSISLPQGVRDILPEEAEKIARVEAAILKVFKKNGFQKVITPLLEYADVLSLGLGEELKPEMLKFIDPRSGRVAAIRPDITPQVARLVAARMKDVTLPLKLCYNSNVLRCGADGAAREILQIGAEYVSLEASPEIDASMIALAIESLKSAGVKNFKIDIGDVGFVKNILGKLKLGEDEKKKIKNLIGKKDASGLDSALKGFPTKISPKEREMLLKLTSFYGEEEVIKKASSFGLAPPAKESLACIKRVLDILANKGYKNFITIDLGEVRGFDYYTGIIFEGFAGGVGKPILGGGRYDTLISKYGYRAKSTGFAFDIENLVLALNKTGD